MKIINKQEFTRQHPELNEMQLQAAWHLSEIEGWDIEGKTAFKDGLTLHLLENGNALTSPTRLSTK